MAVSHGTQSFFQFFGGEAIYTPLKEHPTIGPKLQAIGTPVIVEFYGLGEDLATFQQLSQVVISRYHQTVRADAYSYGAEAGIHRTIRPDEVLGVTPRTEFATAE